MTCPMHPDVVESTPGNCPICKMSLVPVRLESVWTCPVHAVVAADHAGVCPIDHRDLIQVTMAVTFTCAGHPEINQIEAGACSDGKPMIKMRTLRPHGNHNPQYGGQFFMAPDNTHHLEGVLPRARLFRLYLYDDYARPLPADQMKAVKARVVTNETFDAGDAHDQRDRGVPAGQSRARLSRSASRHRQAPGPVEREGQVQERRAGISLRLHVHRALEEARGGRPTPRSEAAPPPVAASPTADAAPGAAPPPAPGAPAADPGTGRRCTIPASVPEILAQLKARNREIGELVDRGAFAAVWVPAFQARDLSIALEARLGDLPAAAREAGDPAIKRLVQTAWLLDAFGDVGNRQQIVDAYAIFGAAVDDVISAFK